MKVEQDQQLLQAKQNELVATDKESARMIVWRECAAAEEMEAAYQRFLERHNAVIGTQLEEEVQSLDGQVITIGKETYVEI